MHRPTAIADHTIRIAEHLIHHHNARAGGPFEGRRYVDSAWWIAALPGAAIFLTSINLVGDGFRDALDPRPR